MVEHNSINLAYGALLLMAAPVAAHAQVGQLAPIGPANESDRPQVDAASDRGDIIVTARRRDERLQDVPISVAVFTGVDTEAKSLRNVQDLTTFTPNISFANGTTRGKGAGSLFIRGIGQPNTDTNFQPGVGMYQDGIYVASMQGMNLDLLDTERVEVLRGPQGTLFGMNTIGGAVNVVTKRPTDEFEGSLEGTLGRFDRREGKVRLNVPIVPGLLNARFAGSIQKADGFAKRIDFVTGRKIDDQGSTDRIAGRALFNLKPSDTFDVLFSIDGMRVRETNTPFQIFNISTGALRTLLNTQLAARGLPLFGTNFVTNDPFVSYGTGLNNYDVDAWNASLIATWDFADNMQLKSLTGYRDLKVDSGNDFDASPYILGEQGVVWNQHQISQEFQFNGNTNDKKLNWVLGLFYIHQVSMDVRQNLFGQTAWDLGGTPDTTGLGRQNMYGDDYAIFGQATYAITEKLNLTLGGRYSKNKRRLVSDNRRGNTGVVTFPFVSGKGSWGAFSGTAALDYHFSEDFMVYGNVGRGFKGGIPEQSNQNQPEVKPEYATSYEIGFKVQALDRKVQLNFAAFHTDYNDQQFFVSRIDNLGITRSFVANAAKSRIRGLEGDLTVRPMEGLTLSGSLGHTDARYLAIGAGLPITTATKFLETPKWTYTLSGEYIADLGNAGTLTPRIDYGYRSALEHDLVNRPTGRQPGYGLLNARLTYQTADEAWSLSVFGTNLTNKIYTVGALTTATATFGYDDLQYGRPREWGATLRYSF